MTDTEKSREDLIRELEALRAQLEDAQQNTSGQDVPRRLFPETRESPSQGMVSRASALSPVESTQSIDLSTLFTGDVTTSGSFDIRGDIWATTFGRVLQALPIPALMIDDASRIVAANQAWGRLGVSDELIRSSLFVGLFCNPEAKEYARHVLEEVFSTRKPRVWQTVMEIDGKKIWGRLTFRSIRVMRERFILALVENLTREKAQLQANERLRVTLENLVKKRTAALAQSNEELKQEIASRQLAQQELREANEKLIWLNAALENRVQERTAQLEASNRELQEEIALRRRVEEALRKSEELHRSIVETAQEGIWVLDADLCTTYVNQTMADMLGYRVEELLGASATDFVSKNHLDDFAGRMERRRAGLSERHEGAFTCKSGEEIWALVSATPLTDDAGDFTGSFAMFTDITERKRMENVLKEAKEAAEDANRAKSEFLARMSHEIRTPINGIVGMTELALETDLTSEQRNYLHSVVLSADTLLRIVNDILDFSRIEAGKFELAPTEFNLRECVFDAMIAPSVEAAAKELELVCHVSSDVPEAVWGDSGRLGQILVNLVGNAVKFTERGEVVTVVDVESVGPDHALLHFCVRDTGIGVAQDHRHRIFEPFEQGEGSTIRKFGGSGLGLTICKQLIAMMEGRLWLGTEVETGSAFHFIVRLGLQKNAVPWPRDSEVSELHGITALIVDDHATTRRALESLLTSWGMVTSSQADGDAALRGLREAAKKGKPYDVMLLDATLPEKNGFEVAETVRKDPFLRKTLIVLLGFTRQQFDARTCEKLGIAGRLSKPVRPSQLLRVLTQGLHRRHMDQAGPGDETSERFKASAQPLRILLVEDNHINRQVAETMLKRMGHTVTLAINGKEAVALHELHDFDLVLMDVEMPEMDGIQATEIIRSHEHGTARRIPIMALTAHAMTGQREAFLAIGMDGYIPKPITYQALFDAIEKSSTSVQKGKESID